MRQSVGTTPCILGKAVDCTYHRGPKYLEVNILFTAHALVFIILAQGSIELPPDLLTVGFTLNA